MDQFISLPRGTADILPEDAVLWQAMESQARALLGIYGYQEIRTPFFEETDLFARSVGQTSDIVQKQMLNLASQADAQEGDKTVSLSLRPEGTASIVRSYIQNRLDKKEKLSKLFYIGPMFRGERPQKGRLRQFHQIGVEAIGPESASPFLDAEVIALSAGLLKSLGVADAVLKINTLGTAQDKAVFAQYLKMQLQAKVSQLCPDCNNRFERNVFRVLDCKNQGCRQTLSGLNLDYSYISEESRRYYTQVKEALNGLGVSYMEDPKLVRGLDYYTHVVFEFSCPRLGSQDAVGAGGRYNNLVEQLGGPAVDAIGFALGMERILLAGVQDQQKGAPGLDVFVVCLDENGLATAFRLLQELRSQGVSSDMNFRLGSMKSQMRQADKAKARFVLILGEEELKAGQIALKDMQQGVQETFRLVDVGQIVSKIQENKLRK